MAERPDLFPDKLEQKIYNPKYLPAEAFPLSDPAKAEIKLGQLLAMTAGIRGNNYAGLPRDAYWKPGSGAHALYVVPSERLVVVKLGGRDGQYDPADTGLPYPPGVGKPARAEWAATAGRESIVKTLELVLKAVARR